ncbi:asialoglycoprotein receptor-like 1 [Synchiropus splendidus]|uniref:asialoglycoprotein receptor-like 1 n=1 Tax=Synchiropus splendidus TaxID=270530 RepID=UPI00237E2362|nr:asialoglycoprotein receptor-like 1 [Synchiropus splendidus]
MEAQYQQFEPPEGSSVRVVQAASPGLKRILTFILYGVLALLLLTLVIIMGVKFPQINQGLADVKTSLERISHQVITSASSAGTASEDVLLQSRVPTRGNCREGWWSFQKSCYLLSTSAVTWSSAESQCVALGGHLVVLNNVEELDYLSEISELRFNYWIGLVERTHEGHWSWVDGTDYASMRKFWDKGQPDDWDYRENGEDCGQLHAAAKRKRRLWNDADCKLSYRYICEARA